VLRMLADPDTRFSATPDGVMRFATFMHRVGIISVAPKSGRICSSPKFKIGPAAEACETRYAVERVGAFVFAIGYKNRGLLLVSLFFWIHYFFLEPHLPHGGGSSHRSRRGRGDARRSPAAGCSVVRVLTRADGL